MSFCDFPYRIRSKYNRGLLEKYLPRAFMDTQIAGAKYGTILGGCLIIIGLGGGLIFQHPGFGVLGILGMAVVILSLAIFGFILPLME